MSPTWAEYPAQARLSTTEQRSRRKVFANS
nr:MAG TPA: hypothetical protein [Caudoviricetes sp.]